MVEVSVGTGLHRPRKTKHPQTLTCNSFSARFHDVALVNPSVRKPPSEPVRSILLTLGEFVQQVYTAVNADASYSISGLSGLIIGTARFCTVVWESGAVKPKLRNKDDLTLGAGGEETKDELEAVVIRPMGQAVVLLHSKLKWEALDRWFTLYSGELSGTGGSDKASDYDRFREEDDARPGVEAEVGNAVKVSRSCRDGRMARSGDAHLVILVTDRTGCFWLRNHTTTRSASDTPTNGILTSYRTHPPNLALSSPAYSKVPERGHIETPELYRQGGRGNTYQSSERTETYHAGSIDRSVGVRDARLGSRCWVYLDLAYGRHDKDGPTVVWEHKRYMAGGGDGGDGD